MTPIRELRIRLLGQLQIFFDSQAVVGLQTDRYQSLVAYLVLKAQIPQPRSHIASLFWPDTSETQAKTNLRRELYRLRQVLPEADKLVQVTTQTIQWQPQIAYWLDVAEFEAKIAQATQYKDDPSSQSKVLKQAIDLYEGELLPTCYDDWIEPERNRLHQLMVNALTDLSLCLVNLGDTRTAIAHTQHLLELEPLSETGYLTLMELYSQQGDRAMALQIYHQCLTQLRDEIGIDPSAQMQTLYQKLINDQNPSSLSVTSTDQPSQTPVIQLPSTVQKPQGRKPTLVGRNQEWQLIESWFSQNSSNLLLLSGEAGIGKTRLLEELATYTAEQGGTLLWGQGFEAELLRPYGAWIDALRTAPFTELDLAVDLPEELGTLLPELGLPEIIVKDRGRLFDAVIRLLSQITEQKSLVVVIFDDIQWLDEASVALLHYGLRILSRRNLYFACSARSQALLNNSAVISLLQALRRDGKLQELSLAPLDKAAIVSLIAHVNHVDNQDIDCNQADQIYIDSGGNPLFALAVAQAPKQHLTSQSKDLVSLVGDRLKRLPETVQSLLPWATALGHSFDPMLLSEIAACSPQQIFRDLESLETANILRPANQSDSYEFAHDLVRQGIYQKISAPRRRLMHRQIAEYLDHYYENQAAKMVEVVHHAAIAQNSELITKAAIIAAQYSLSLFAFGEATELAQLGLVHCHNLAVHTRVSRQLDLLRVKVWAGVPNDDLETMTNMIKAGISEAQVLNLQEAEATGQEALLQLNYDQDQFDELHQQSFAAAERAQSAHPSPSAKLLAYGGSCLATLHRDMDRAEAMLLEAESLADRVSLKISDIYVGLGMVYHYQGRLQLAYDYLNRALDICKAKQDHLQHCMTLMELAMLAVEQGKWDEVIAQSQTLISLAQKLTGGSEASFGKALEALAHYALATINVEDVASAIQELIDLDAQRKLAFVLSHQAAIELDQQCPQDAVKTANLALKSAEIVGNSNDVAMAWSLLIRAKVATNDTKSLDIPQILEQIKAWLKRNSLSDWVVHQLTALQQQLTS